MSTKKMITLKSSDGETFDIEEAVAIQSETIKLLIEDGCADNAIPLANVNSEILAKVIEYCKKHVVDDDNDSVSDEKTKEELKKWDAEEFLNIDNETLFELMLAANYLNVKNLLDLTCETVADMVPGKNPEELRATFGIVSDFTKEEEDEIRKENPWAFP